MSIPPILLLLSACALGCAAPAQEHHPPTTRAKQATANLPTDEARTVALYAAALPTVVTVFTVRSGPGGAGLIGLGAGVLVSDGGLVVTADHVVADADKIVVKTHDGNRQAAEVLFREPGADVALLRLQKPAATLQYAKLGDSDRLSVGQKLYVIGNPNGLENSLSVGRVSAFREFNRLYDGSIRVDFIQTDAAINSGNSGGPVFDSSGRLVGIASRIMTHSGGSEGIGFVVAINAVRQLLALGDRAWTGMQGVFLSQAQLATLFNLTQSGGLLVQRVAKNSPADKAGLRGGIAPLRLGDSTILLGGDLILQLGDQDACHSGCLAAAHKRLSKRDKIRVTFLRAGKVMSTTLDVTASRKNFLGAAR